jgi:hypothetical protein
MSSVLSVLIEEYLTLRLRREGREADRRMPSGDALTVVNVPTLLVPGQTPWMRFPDLIECLRLMASERAYAIHDGLLNE